MKEIISTELLSQVLQLHNEPFDLLIDGSYLKFSHYVDYISNNPIEPYQCSKSDDNINLYELAHKCKEWALRVPHIVGISSGQYRLNNYCTIQFAYEYVGHKDEIHQSHADTEPEAIFKSCQWILDNKDRQ